jgi:hypothetical protein
MIATMITYFNTVYKQPTRIPTLNKYITRIRSNDKTLTTIDLKETGLNDADAQSLMKDLSNNPEVAQRIMHLFLTSNLLTSINIPAELTALEWLFIGKNQLTNINIPATLIALQTLDLYNNQLTSIDIPATLTALRWLSISRNRLTSINIPATLTALQQLHLSVNRLTNINIPVELTELWELNLSLNQLTSINIPAELTAMINLDLSVNQLTSINIPAELTALEHLYIYNNQLTMVIKLALRALRDTRPNLTIQDIDNANNIAAQLTPEILLAHFEITKPRLLPNMISVEFKEMVLVLEIMPTEIVSIIASFLENNPKLLLGKNLDKNIQMLRRYFNNDETNKEILNYWLMSNEMNKISAIPANAQITAIKKLDAIYNTNWKKL